MSLGITVGDKYVFCLSIKKVRMSGPTGIRFCYIWPWKTGSLMLRPKGEMHGVLQVAVSRAIIAPLRGLSRVSTVANTQC
jgi:hypothetical protein